MIQRRQHDIFRLDNFIGGKAVSLFHNISKLTYVAWPVVLFQFFQSRFTEYFARCAVVSNFYFRQKALYQPSDIPFSFPEGRNVQCQSAQAEVQIFAEGPGLHEGR